MAQNVDQNNQLQIVGRMAELYLNEYLSDVEFLVGSEQTQERFAAHKFVLTLASPYFSTLLSAQFEEGITGRVPVTDVEPEIFQYLLCYIYTGEFDCTNVSDIINVYHLASRYLLQPLAMKCLNSVSCTNISSKDFWFLFQTLLLHKSSPVPPTLLVECWRYLDANISSLVCSADFTRLSVEYIQFVLRRDSLIINELELFKALKRWSVTQCCCQRRPVSPMNKRQLLEPLIPLLRLLTLSSEEFKNFYDDPENSEMFSEEELAVLKRAFYSAEGGEVSTSPWGRKMLRRPRGSNNGLSWAANQSRTVIPNPGENILTNNSTIMLVAGQETILMGMTFGIFMSPNDPLTDYSFILSFASGTNKSTRVGFNTSDMAPFKSIQMNEPQILKPFVCYYLEIACSNDYRILRNGLIGNCGRGNECLLLVRQLDDPTFRDSKGEQHWKEYFVNPDSRRVDRDGQRTCLRSVNIFI